MISSLKLLVVLFFKLVEVDLGPIQSGVGNRLLACEGDLVPLDGGVVN